MNRRLCVVFVVLLVAPIGCDRPSASSTPNTTVPTTTVKLAGRSFTLEIANTHATRQKGLMFRNAMPADHGMLFVFPDSRPRSFYMKNTKIPLDILYLDDAGKIVSVHALQPYDESAVWSAAPARYAVELNQGTAKSLGLKAGDVVEIPEAARTARE